MQPILSICVPTYNRLPYLKELLEKLLPQLNDQVEVLVSDNCSDDGTWEYLLGIDNITKFRQVSNIGADPNIQSVIQRAETEYVWLLCDDDLPSMSLIANVIDAINSYYKAPLIYLRAYPMGRRGEGYNPNISTNWTTYSFEEFLKEVGIWFTFGSSIVARKDCLDLEFAKKWVDKSLSPAAMALSAAFYEQKVILSDVPVIAARGGNSGGYDGITVFTKNVYLLLNEFSHTLSKSTIRIVMEDSLLIVAYILPQNSYNLSFSSFINLIKYGWHYKKFYTVIVPSLIPRSKYLSVKLSRLKAAITYFPKKFLKKIVK